MKHYEFFILRVTPGSTDFDEDGRTGSVVTVMRSAVQLSETGKLDQGVGSDAGVSTAVPNPGGFGQTRRNG